MSSVIRLYLYVFLFYIIFSCTHEDVKPVQENGIYINEIAAKGGEDWLEIYNNLDRSENLGGYFIYDDPDLKFKLPNINIPAKGFIVLICDGTGTGSNPNFRLSSAGEVVFLESPDGALVDKVLFPAMSGSQSFARFPDGAAELFLTGEPTRGISNGSGQVPTLRNAKRDPLIPGISGQVNISVEAADPRGLKSVKLFFRFNGASYQFVNMTLNADLYTASIPAAGTTGQMDYYIEAVNTLNLTGRQPSSAPGTPYFYILNNDPLPALVINEYLAFNAGCCTDPDGAAGEFDDWIEIYNKGNIPVDLAGMYLSDSIANPFKFRIPATNSSATTIPAGGFLVIYADEQGTQGPLHANFKLSQFGEQVGLFFIDGRTIDTRVFGAQEADKSEGRKPDGSEVWTKMNPTRGTANQ
ncbi:MAG: lamin tail domain-containing protein [Cyclobacteriaceae bacterium]